MSAPKAGRQQFQLERWIRAAPQAVFDAWTTASRLGWFFNPRMPRPDAPIEVDLRVGGVWRQMMVIDAETQYVTGGVYLEIVPGRRLVFAWGAVDGWPRLDLDRLDHAPRVSVTFQPERDGTRMTLDVDVPDSLASDQALAHMMQAVQSGWRDTIERCLAEA